MSDLPVSDLEVFSSLKTHPGWQQVEAYIQKRAYNLTFNRMRKKINRGEGDELHQEIIEIDALLSIIQWVDRRLERAQKGIADNPDEGPAKGE